MAFRWRISLFVVLALLIALLAQFLLGYWLFRQTLNHDLAVDLERFALWLEQGLVETPQGISLSPESLNVLSEYSSYADGRGRVLDEQGHAVLLVGGVFPKVSSGWQFSTRKSSAYTLEVAMSRRTHNTALQEYLRASIIGLPILIVLFGLLGLLLVWRLLVPLRTLQMTVNQVSGSANLAARVEVGLADDELSKLARSYNKMMERLEAFFERERSFTRNVSHELRNPLTALRVQVDAALSGGLPPATMLPAAKRELARMSTIVDSLLILARDELKPNTFCDLAGLARESIDRARLLANDKPLDIDYQGPRHLPFKGDRELLGRMMDNLLENAVNYSASGQIVLKLQEAEELILHVSDQGVGVAPDLLARLGTPFFRAKATQTRGQGLGLSVVMHIARAHGASISFANLEPAGFAVTIRFPVTETET